MFTSAAVVERFNRTLKERMYRYFTHKHTYRYIDVLQDFVAAYNKTPHSTIKMPPAAVTIYNAHIARENLVKARTFNRYHTRRNRRKKRRPLFNVNDYVRISREKNVFEKGVEKKWSEEIFKIKKILNRQNLFVYELCDLDGEDIEGFFYQQELTRVHPERVEDQQFTIDKILRSRGTGPKKEYYVSWVGYPEKFNSWVSAKDLTKIK